MRILIIEDNPDIVANLYGFLEPKGHVLDSAANGYGGLALAAQNDYDAVVLDVMLPGMNGLELCQKLRGELRKDMPVLMLTARDTLDDKVAGFDSGADDYLVKPFSLVELEVRLKALVRRAKGAHAANAVLSFGDLTFDTETFEAKRAGRPLALTKTGYTILRLLMREAPKVVSREQVEREIWGDDPPDTDALRVHIHALRQALDKPFPHQMLRTISKIGYKLVDASDAGAMNRKDSLRRRITVAYLTFATVSSVFFAVIAALAVEGIEVRLVDVRLEEVAEWAGPRHAGGLPVEMPAGLSYHVGEGIPRSLRALEEGVHEVTIEGVDLHVLKGHNAEGEFAVVDHDSAYEKIELVVYSMFAVAFLGFMGFAVVLGRFLGNRIVTPIVELAQAVEARAPVLPLRERGDELGLLSRTIAGHTEELRQFLDRERFFTGDVSHELRTPLTVIAGAAEVLLARTEHDPVLHAPAERIYRAARDASDVTSMLLRLARSPERLEWSQMSAEVLAREEVARCQVLVAGRPIELRFGGGADFTVHGVRELVLAAIGNLVRNACQYTEEGHVEVRLEGRSVVVEDTGPGLPPAARARLRDEPIPPDARGSSGTGLGLGIVQRISAHLGATLVLREVPAGSCIELRFPEGRAAA